MRHLLNVTAFVVSFLLALVCLDVYLQLAEIQTPMETRIDERLGPTYIPGRRFSRFNEGFYLGEANAYGYMGPSVPPARANGELRILLLGDSFLLGHTVLPRHHFARSLEVLLSGATGKPVKALNFAKADFDLQDMYLYYRDFASTFDHDLALFFVDEGDLVPVRKGAPGLQPVLTLAGSALVADRNFANGPVYRFYRSIQPALTRSAVLRLAFNAVKMVNRGELTAVLLDKLAPPPPRPGASPKRAVALSALSRAILLGLRGDPRNVIVIQKTLPSTVHEELRTLGLPIVDLGSVLKAREARGERPYFWPVTRVQGHWNHATHQVIAQFLSQEIARRGLLGPAAPAAGSPAATR